MSGSVNPNRLFRRAPKDFSERCVYTGMTKFSGITPEMYICKECGYAEEYFARQQILGQDGVSVSFCRVGTAHRWCTFAGRQIEKRRKSVYSRKALR